MDWPLRVIDVHTYRTEAQIRELFSNCGEIRVLLPWSTGRTYKRHYFIEYTDTRAVDRARSVFSNTGDIQVHSLANNKEVATQRTSLTSSGSDIAHTERDETRQPHVRTRSISTPHRRTSSHSRSSSPRPLRRVMSPCAASASTANPSLAFSRIFTAEPNCTISTRPQGKDDAYISGGETSAKDSDPKSPTGQRLPLSNQNQNLASATPSKTQISIHYCSEIIKYDLETLEPDPTAIILLLQQSRSDVGNWMMVGAHYRRNGNYESALTIAKALLQAMAEMGYPEPDKRPVYILLSQCHLDIAKRRKEMDGSEPQSADMHFKSSIKLLQQVYGTDQYIHGSMGVDTLLNTRETVAETAAQTSKRKDGPANSDKENEEPARDSDRSPSLSTATPGPSLRTNLPDPDRRKDRRSHPHAVSPPRNAPTTTNAVRLKRLQAELSTLRERHAASVAALGEARAAKRVAEDDASAECAKRRRVEKKLRDADDALSKHARMEGYARDERKREGEARRKLEGRLEEERRARAALEVSVRERSAKLIFGELAGLFGKAAESPTSLLGAIEHGDALSQLGKGGKSA